MKTRTLPFKYSMNRSSCPLALLLIPLAFACFALSPDAQAVDPPPDGGYPNQNTAEGMDALFNLNVDPDEGGYNNTAVGFNALYSDTDGSANTATGAFALRNNTTGNENTAFGNSALYKTQTGSFNTAVGSDALRHNPPWWQQYRIRLSSRF